ALAGTAAGDGGAVRADRRRSTRERAGRGTGMTRTIETTLGPFPVATLGRVNAHDHVILEGGVTTVNEPDFRLDSVDKAAEELRRWRASGGGAVVDTQPFGCGR